MTTIPLTSRAVVIRDFAQPATLSEVPVPTELEDGALLVNVEACSICGTDVHLWQGELDLRVDLPVILGHEMVGRIVKVGKNAETDSFDHPLEVGDRIIWSHAECGRCRYCVSGQPTLCSNLRKYMYETSEAFPYLMGGFSEYSYVLPGSGRVKVPEAVPNELASLCSCAFRSVVKAFNEVGQLSPSDTVLIQGVGPLGLLAVAMAKLAGAKEIIALGDPEARLELAREFGATETISINNTTVEERAALIAERTHGIGPDLVFEFSGNPHAFNEGLSVIRPGGRYMVVGQLGKGTVQVAPSMITKKNLKVMGSFSGSIQNYWQALQIIEKHQHELPFHKLITGKYSLDETDKALNAMRSETEIKPLLIP